MLGTPTPRLQRVTGQWEMSVQAWTEGVMGTTASSMADGRDQVVAFSLRPLPQCCVTWAACEAEAVGMSGDRQQWGHIV